MKAFVWSGLLGGSWVVIGGVITRVTIVTTHVEGPITLLITTHEPPSRLSDCILLRLEVGALMGTPKVTTT